MSGHIFSRFTSISAGVASATLVLAFTLAPTAQAAPNESCTGSPTAECADVTADGIRYTSGVTTVNIGDAAAGTASVNAGTTGIELSRSGVSGAVAPDAAFLTIAWDTDGDPDTAAVDVVSQDGSTPHLVGGAYITVQSYDSNGDPATFGIGATTYTGVQLAAYLAANSSGSGTAISGSLTVNNNAGGAGAPFATTNAPGISIRSTGGNGGSGGCYTILFLYTWCDNGYAGGDAGSVAVNSDATITVLGLGEGKHAISAVSQGGIGGNGGGFVGLVSEAGAGGNGGKGALVSVLLGPHSNLTTQGAKSHGVFAESRGGNGGSGGNADGAGALGSAGGNGGDAGDVVVTNQGRILTQGWNSHGIYARSVGAGAGSGSSADGLYAEGGNGGGESSGAAVTVNNSGTITTELSDSFGILAQSIGGGGGDGGGAGGWFTVGGRGGSGGGAGVVTVHDSGKVQTGTALGGDRSTAIFAQSIGGGGGNGGDAVSASPLVSVAVGGAGGLGGDGNNVTVTADGSDIDTTGNDAHGIQAQSIGGGGGNGGVAVSGKLPGTTPFNISVALGGDGGGGGSAGSLVRVETLAGTTIDTAGTRAYGIIAQSIGGGGGNGSTALSASGGPGLSVAVSLGGKGGVAGAGKNVDVDNAATITTTGSLSAGIFVQSIGGGGGNGGYAGSLAVGGSSASVSVGGAGASGGAAGEVAVDNTGIISTGGQGAAGIFAQSIGGGGGNGGSALAGSIGLASVSTTVGGAGGAGNYGNLVDVTNGGLITTRGNNSAGIFAQSIGGGGGAGGDATSLSLAGPVAIAVAVGGSGGSGGDGGAVLVTNTGRIEVSGPNSDGVFAQSIGGGGGAGGSATTGTLAFPIEIEGVQIPAIQANVSVGGRGGGGGTAGTVGVTNDGTIETGAFMSNGVFAQSVGGSGGRGGNATNIAISYDATFTGKVAVGGSGGLGGIGNVVTVGNTGLITTHGDFSSGVLAQSVGGGGGTGGNATNVSLSLTPPPTAPEDFIPSPSVNFDLTVGGDGGSGAHGGAVNVTNLGSIETHGKFATGVMAQSVGGAGGIGGDARSIQVELTADPMDFLPLTSLAGLDITMVFGGSGGAGSYGDAVALTNTGNVTTRGAFAHGIVAQSVGGGGGSGGSAMSFSFSNADVVPEIPVLDDISGLTTLEMTLQGSGGAGGDGGPVTLNSTGTVRTSGAFAMGVVAQSVAGGGGLAGFYNPQGVVRNLMDNEVFNAVVDSEAGLSFSGSVGGAGNAGNVILNHTGRIETQGDGAHGIFAQSAAGQGTAGSVTVMLDGSILAAGRNADGIYAQSGGGAGNGAIEVTINAGGSVTGGSGSGAGVVLVGGTANSIVNHGSIGALSGNAIVGGSGADAVTNHGSIVGNVDLGAGANSFSNLGGALFSPLATVVVGTGQGFANTGTLSPGGAGIARTTALTGNLSQGGTGVLALDISLAGLDSDRLDVTGSAALGGGIRLNPIDTGQLRTSSARVVLTAGDGVVVDGLSVTTPTSSIVRYQLSYPSANEIAVSTSVDFAPASVGGNSQRIGRHINGIVAAGGSAGFAPIATALVNLPDDASLVRAYEKLGPGAVGNVAGLSSTASLEFNDAMHSCRQREGEQRFIREGECSWLRVGGGIRDQERGDLNSGYRLDAATVAGGVQREVAADTHFGFGLAYQQADLDSNYSNVNGDRYEAGLILKRRYDATRISGSLSAGYGSYDSHRLVDVATPGVRAVGKQEIWSVSLHGRISQDLLARDDLYLRPMVGLGLMTVSRAGYAETGAGGANLHVAKERDNFVTLHPAVEVGGERSLGDGTLLRPYLRLGLTRFLTDNDRQVTASLESAPAGVEPFTVVTEGDRNYLDLAFGIDVLKRQGVTMRFDYTGQFSRNSSAHAVGAKFTWPF